MSLTVVRAYVHTNLLADAEDEGEWVVVKPRLAICEENFIDCKDSRKRLSFVIRCCVGRALNVIKCYERMAVTEPEKAYQDAKAALRDKFGAVHVIVSTLARDCTEGPAFKAKDIEGLKDLSIKMHKCEIELGVMGRVGALQSDDKLEKIYSLLPNECRTLWLKKLRILNDAGTVPSFTHMRGVIEDYVKSRDNQYFIDTPSPTSASSTASSSNSKPPAKQVLATDTQSHTDSIPDHDEPQLRRRESSE